MHNSFDCYVCHLRYIMRDVSLMMNDLKLCPLLNSIEIIEEDENDFELIAGIIIYNGTPSQKRPLSL